MLRKAASTVFHKITVTAAAVTAAAVAAAAAYRKHSCFLST